MGNGTAAISGLLAESILFATFLGVCTGLLKRRFSVKKTALLACVFAAFILFLNIEVFLNSQELLTNLSLFPMTLYLPAAAGLFLLSGSGIFQTASGLFSALPELYL